MRRHLSKCAGPVAFWREAIAAGFLHPAVPALLHPEGLPALVDEGHEIGLTSCIHASSLALVAGGTRPACRGS